VGAAADAWYGGCGYLLTALAMSYALTAWLATALRAGSSRCLAQDRPAATLLKPLCGAEHELYANLRTFCEQTYPLFQIVFGVREAADPAVAIVRRLQNDFPALELQIAIDPAQHGSSGKVSNLINMMPLARYGYLVLSDSDMRVPRDYLANVIAPLLDLDVGIVTCPYRGHAQSGLWSRLGALFLNDWFMPSVHVAALFGSRAFAFGATIALRREVLERIGGFAAIADQLADDYRLGELTRNLGMRTVLSQVVVETCVDEHSAADLVRHELRWLRTIRAVRPVGYALAFVTFGVPVAAMGALLARGAAPALAMLGVTAMARLMLHFANGRPRSAVAQVWLLPFSDLLSFALWCWGFVTRRVQWRHARYRIARDGSAQPIP
jgi:ceramide glucosyltransferase